MLGDGPGLARDPSASRSRRPSRSPRRTRTRTTRWAACSTTCACTRRSSARRPSSRWQLAEDEPDVVIGCIGGGSNFAGIAFPYYHRKLEGKSNARLLAVEPKACPTLTAGEYRYDLGDEAGMTPQMLMYTLGHDFVPAGIHAGRPALPRRLAARAASSCTRARSRASPSTRSRASTPAVQFARAEGILPAPESSHAIRAAINEAQAAQAAGEDKRHPLQPLRPRPLRPGRLRGVQRRRPAGLRLRGRFDALRRRSVRRVPSSRGARLPERAPRSRKLATRTGVSTTCTALASRSAASPTPHDAALAVAAGADALGVIFAPSPRQVTVEQAAAALAEVPPPVGARRRVRRPERRGRDASPSRRAG